LSGHVFHPGHQDLHGITVVVETDGALTYVGRFDTEDETGVHLMNVGVHHAVAGGSKEEYVKRSAKFGVRADQKHLVIPRQQVARITKLVEIEP
jgi:hypothetical protein